jgi:hypothetical protein
MSILVWCTIAVKHGAQLAAAPPPPHVTHALGGGGPVHLLRLIDRCVSDLQAADAIMGWP